MSNWQPIAGLAGLSRFVRLDAGVPMFSSLALALNGGGSLVVSALPSDVEDDFAALEEIGSPAMLLAPNHYHNLGLKPFIKRYPAAMAVSSDAARPRLVKQTSLPIGSLDALSERLPRGVSILQPEGLKQGEVWLRFETPEGVVWAVCDAFFNVTPAPSSFFGGFLWLTQGAPGLRIGGTFLLVGIADKKRYSSWLRERLASDRPIGFIPAHGEPIFAPDLADQLAEIVRRRVG